MSALPSGGGGRAAGVVGGLWRGAAVNTQATLIYCTTAVHTDQRTHAKL